MLDKKPTLCNYYDSRKNGGKAMKKKFLFVTANSHETAALLKDKSSFVYEEKRSPLTTDSAFYNVGKFGEYDVVHFELVNQASIKSDASILAIYDAIEAWCPDAVILIGIAFGKDDEDMLDPRQHIGDVLISKMVADYESEKIKDGVHQSDGFIAESGRHLISVFQHYSRDWNHVVCNRKVDVIMGLMLSGDRVVDDQGFKDKLFSRFPRAIGGEMEGRGAYSACRRKGIDEWIIVKAICDWGVNKAGNKTENQIIASESSASLLRYIFSKPDAFDKLPSQKSKTIGGTGLLGSVEINYVEGDSLNDNAQKIDFGRKNVFSGNVSIESR